MHNTGILRARNCRLSVVISSNILPFSVWHLGLVLLPPGTSWNKLSAATAAYRNMSRSYSRPRDAAVGEALLCVMGVPWAGAQRAKHLALDG